jgi:DNA repair exonuclease SbcCD nuclease subunit
MPYPKSNEALKRIANRQLKKMLKAGDVFPEEAEISVNTVGRYLKKLTRSANQPIRQK